jgi:hypothetical protein
MGRLKHQALSITLSSCRFHPARGKIDGQRRERESQNGNVNKYNKVQT